MTKENDTVVADAALLDAIDPSSTMDLHRSNLLRMQVNELLEECQLDLKTRNWATEAHEYLQELAKIIAQVNHKTIQAGEAAVKDRADKVVHIDSLSEKNNISKNNPKNSSLFQVEPIGCTKSQLGWTKKSGNAQMLPTFSLMVILPQELFLPKDYNNYRYFDKRNHVMQKIAHYLAKQSKKLGSIEYKWSKGMGRSPYLQLVPPSAPNAKSNDKKGSPKFQVHLHFGMKSIDWIPPLRLVPNRCNIKQHMSETSEASSSEGAKSIQSQLYNQSLLYDARHQFEDHHLATLVNFPNVEATLVLIQVWALKRGLWRNHDGWSKENVAMFLLYLLRTNRMNPRMTPIQQFTVALQTWSTTNWLGQGRNKSDNNENTKNDVRASQSQATPFIDIDSSKKRCRRDVLVLPREGSTEKETIRQSDLARIYEKQTKDAPLTDNDPPTLIDAYASLEHYILGPVMLDPTMTYNYLGDVSPNYMKLLQSHAVRSLQSLQASRSAFESTFLKNARFWSQWDVYVQIPTNKSSKEEWEPSTRALLEKLELALGNRIHGIRVLSTGNGDVLTEKELSDQYPTEIVSQHSSGKRPLNLSPTGSKKIVLGLAVSPETSERVVDRGPPSDRLKDVKAFVDLWGEKAQLRRFKDGAIVQAVVWNDDNGEQTYQNQVKLQGGYTEKILRHIVRLHYTKQSIDVALPNILSVVDGIATKGHLSDPLVDPLMAHKQVMKVFESLSRFLRDNSMETLPNRHQQSTLGLPLAIDAVEPLSPCLRYSELFPPIPHPLLGGSVSAKKKVSGALMSDPILIQIRFGASSKWPSDLNAIGAAKTAMLIQLANGIENLSNRDFDGPILVTPTHLDLGYQGYCFRILVRADPEIKMLQGLVRPSAAASALLQDLTRKHVVGAKHHSMIHGVHSLHPSSGSVVRMAKRWVANHLLSGLITTEAIELMVTKVYSDDETAQQPPSTVSAGFIRFLHLLASHDWLGEPLIVNPRNHIGSSDIDEIHHHFEKARGEKRESGPPMYIIAPYDRHETEDDDPMDRNAVIVTKNFAWKPSVASPEWVVVTRAVALAKRSYGYIMQRLVTFDNSSDWSAIFHESPTSFQSYSVLFRVSDDLVIDQEASSTGGDLNPMANEDGILETSYTRSMKARAQGPKGLRRKVYKNLQVSANDPADQDSMLLCWQPIESVVSSLRQKFGGYALFFYNELAPEVIGLVWRPSTFKAMPFSAMTAEHAKPQEDRTNEWRNDSFVVRNATDLLREMSEYYQDVITTAKIIDESCLSTPSKKRKIAQ